MGNRVLWCVFEEHIIDFIMIDPNVVPCVPTL